MADGVAGEKIGCEVIDDGADHGIEVGDFVVQFEVSPRERFQADPVGGVDIAIGGEVRSPGRQGANELHAGHRSQRAPQRVRGADNGVLDHLESHTPRRHGRLPAGHEDAQGFDHAVTASGCHRARAGESRMRSVLGIEIVVLATSAPVLLVRRGDFKNLDPGILGEAQQAGTPFGGRLSSGPVCRPAASAHAV